MNKWMKIAALALVAPTMFIVGCSDDDDDNDNQDQFQNISGLTCTGDQCIMSGTITDNITLTAGRTYLLRGGVFIGDDVNPTELRIEPGVTIVGEQSTNGFLCIRRNAKIFAEGTADAPIVFTSSLPEGQRNRGDWGGLIINGKAPLNTGSEAFGEGGTGYYGGNDSNDNSGVLRYVRVEFAGRIISPENELNGIAFQGVGGNTVAEYVQVHMNKDDGIEFFGGTAGIKYALVTGAADDSFDWTDGWVGKAQFVILQQYADDGDQGIEADNNGEDNTLQPRSNPMLSNFTIIGSPQSSSSDIGVLFREGTGAKLYNSVITGFNDAAFDVDQSETFANAYTDDTYTALTGGLMVENTVLFGDGNDVFKEDDGEPVTIETFLMRHNVGNSVEDPRLANPYSVTSPGFAPQSGSVLESGAKAISDTWFTSVGFRGAVDPANDWTAGWTIATER